MWVYTVYGYRWVPAYVPVVVHRPVPVVVRYW